jgi:MFS family permease
MFLLSCWYPRKELALRTAILYSGVLLATAFSGLIAAGVLSGLEGARGMAGWQWLFILEGAGSFVAAIVAFFVLPDFPGQKTGAMKWLLSDDEQKVAVERINRDRVSLPDADHGVFAGLMMAVKDLRTWVFVSFIIARRLMGMLTMNRSSCLRPTIVLTASIASSPPSSKGSSSATQLLRSF